MRYALLVLAVLASGCASIVNGGLQDIPLSSSPSGAKVTIDGQPAGVTPTVVKLSRKSRHIIVLEKDGYETVETPVTNSANGWVFGNILFGVVGLFGLLVDVGVGGMYSLTPETFSIPLEKKAAELPVAVAAPST